MKNQWRSEPVAIATLVTAGINVLVEFGFDLTVGQRSALLAVTLAAAGFVMRQSVWSPQEHDSSLAALQDSLKPPVKKAVKKAPVKKIT